MQLQTYVELPDNPPRITHSDKLLMLGSCFAESIGTLLVNHKFRCDVNPFGILYNPFSISKALDHIMEPKVYNREDLFQYQGLFHSFMHHSSFSACNEKDVLRVINQRIEQVHQHLSKLSYLIITFGTAWVYTRKDTGDIVSNCHKLPEKEFTRRRLDIEEIISTFTRTLNLLFELNPALQVIFTVSPIRHSKDGMHGNQLSKSILLLSIDKLKNNFPAQVIYFPSYEIMLDELRDYRFYAEDMLHPSSVAIQYVWEYFTHTFFSAETQNIMKECQSIYKALNHKPFNADSERYKNFLGQIVLKIERLTEKYPNLDVQKELHLCHTLLRG